jgi:hypothetical protein
MVLCGFSWKFAWHTAELGIVLWHCDKSPRPWLSVASAHTGWADTIKVNHVINSRRGSPLSHRTRTSVSGKEGAGRSWYRNGVHVTSRWLQNRLFNHSGIGKRVVLFIGESMALGAGVFVTVINITCRAKTGWYRWSMGRMWRERLSRRRRS